MSGRTLRISTQELRKCYRKDNILRSKSRASTSRNRLRKISEQGPEIVEMADGDNGAQPGEGDGHLETQGTPGGNSKTPPPGPRSPPSSPKSPKDKDYEERIANLEELLKDYKANKEKEARKKARDASKSTARSSRHSSKSTVKSKSRTPSERRSKKAKTRSRSRSKSKSAHGSRNRDRRTASTRPSRSKSRGRHSKHAKRSPSDTSSRERSPARRRTEAAHRRPGPGHTEDRRHGATAPGLPGVDPAAAADEMTRYTAPGGHQRPPAHDNASPPGQAGGRRIEPYRHNTRIWAKGKVSHYQSQALPWSPTIIYPLI